MRGILAGRRQECGQRASEQLAVEEHFEDLRALRDGRSRRVVRAAVLEHAAHVREPLAHQLVLAAVELLLDRAEICTLREYNISSRMPKCLSNTLH